MANLGAVLRAARQDMGMTLSEVEQATKIRYRYLLALEEEDFASLPESIYVYGFLRTYARYLGLDANEAVELFKEQSGRQDPAGVQPDTVILREAIRPRSVLSTNTVAAITIAIGMLVLLYFGYQQFLGAQSSIDPDASQTRRTATAAPAVARTAAPTAPAAATSAVKPTPAATAGPAATATGGAQANQGVTVALRIVGNESWVRTVVDDLLVEQAVLKTGDTRIWRGNSYVVLRLGNAAAVDVTVNGVPQGILGGPYDVIEREWRAGAVH